MAYSRARARPCRTALAERLLLRRSGIVPRARPFERIAAFLNLPFDVARSARRSAKVLEPIVMRLKLVVGDPPVLDRHVFGQKSRAISFRQMRPEAEIGRQEAPRLRVPVDASAADAGRRHERAPVADRQRCLAHIVAKSERLLLGAKEQLMPEAIAQFVLIVGRSENPSACRATAPVRSRRRPDLRRSIHWRGSNRSSRGR